VASAPTIPTISIQPTIGDGAFDNACTGRARYPLTCLCYTLTHRQRRALPQTNLATRTAIKAYLT